MQGNNLQKYPATPIASRLAPFKEKHILEKLLLKDIEDRPQFNFQQ